MKEPIGTLTLGVIVNTPPKRPAAAGTETWQALNHVYEPEKIAVSTVSCTQAEAAKIAEKFKTSNGGRTFAAWTGEVSL